MIIVRSEWTLRLLGIFLIVLSSSARANDEILWQASILDWGKTPWHVAPVDLSFLNSMEKPAGLQGFLKTEKSKLVFEDGTPSRFWGTNLTAHALFGMASHEDVRLQARRLSQLDGSPDGNMGVPSCNPPSSDRSVRARFERREAGLPEYGRA
jgi:hypothetical protein